MEEQKVEMYIEIDNGDIYIALNGAETEQYYDDNYDYADINGEVIYVTPDGFYSLHGNGTYILVMPISMLAYCDVVSTTIEGDDFTICLPFCNISYSLSSPYIHDGFYDGQRYHIIDIDAFALDYPDIASELEDAECDSIVEDTISDCWDAHVNCLLQRNVDNINKAISSYKL